MRIYLVNDYNDLSKRAAQLVESQIRLKPDSVLGLATGGTPIGMYNELIKMHKEDNLDFSEVKTFNLDEYYMLSKESPHSYHYYMRNNLFKHINIDINNTNIINGMCKDISKECIKYEKEIKEAGGIDLQVLGIGRNGHIGFNEPNLKFEALTHLVELDQDTVNANSRYFENKSEVPTKAISMGIKTIMRSRKILLLANGAEKAKAIKKALVGEIKPDVPASILQLHQDVTVIVDKEAGKYIEIDETNNRLKQCS